MLKTDEVHIWRDVSGDYRVEWQASHPDTEVLVEPLAEDGGVPRHGVARVAGGTRISGLPPARRHRFRISDQHGNSVLAGERRLAMEGAPNFRDFGGYSGSDGRRVKWGHLFRSGQLTTLSDRDLTLLASLDLELVCDFRRLEEQDSDPSRLPSGGRLRVASLPIIPGSNGAALAATGGGQGHGGRGPDWAGRQEMFDFMVAINRDFATNQAPTYATMFREILELNDGRLLLHCAAGKDRTGFGVALILLALGVPEAVVMRDYLLTGRFFEPARELDRLRSKYGMEQLPADTILPMLEVHEAYLNTALQTIVEEFGSVAVYLREVLRLGPQELALLRGRYLE